MLGVILMVLVLENQAKVPLSPWRATRGLRSILQPQALPQLVAASLHSLLLVFPRDLVQWASWFLFFFKSWLADCVNLSRADWLSWEKKEPVPRLPLLLSCLTSGLPTCSSSCVPTVDVRCCPQGATFLDPALRMLCCVYWGSRCAWGQTPKSLFPRLGWRCHVCSSASWSQGW